MAKETTEVYNIKVVFPTEDDKFKHTIRNFSKEIKVEQTDSDKLSDVYTVKLGFQTTEKKFRDLFCKGEWVKSLAIKILNSDSLSDEFEVVAISAGGKKKFIQTFERQGGYKTRFKVDATLVSTKTKNLGVLHPYGNVASKSKKEALGIMKLLFIEAATLAGLSKISKIPNAYIKDQYAISILGGYKYFDSSSPLVCITLAGWKIGFESIKNKSDYFKIVVAYPTKPEWSRNKEPSYNKEYKSDFTIIDRVKTIKIPSKWGGHITSYEWRELFLGDPNLNQTLVAFFKSIANTPLPSLK